MENRPFRTPIYALILHLGVTIIFICAPPAGDAFTFIVSLSSYPTTALLAAITVGLIKIRLDKRENWKSPFPAPWAVLALYLAANIVSAYFPHLFSHFEADKKLQFLLVMPFVRPPNGKGSTSLPYWLSSVVALSILSLGVIYYAVRFVIAPLLFKYKHEEIKVALSDGSRVTRFRRVSTKA